MLRRTAREAGVADRVLLTGERPCAPDGTPGPDLPSLTSAMDVLAAPSPEEAFGLAVVEGLASGLPVLFSSCPAIEDLPPQAAPAARRVTGGPAEFARALAEVRGAAGPGPGPRTAPEAARHYCVTRSAARLLDVYAAALSHPLSRHSRESVPHDRVHDPSPGRDRGTGRGGRAARPAPPRARRAASRPAPRPRPAAVVRARGRRPRRGPARRRLRPAHPARYTATSYVVAVPADASDPASALGFAQAYGRVATQLAVLADAQMWAHVPVTTLRESVRTATSPDAPMVSVSATSSSPEEAADMADAVARALTRHAAASADDTRVELRQFAAPPSPPSRPRRRPPSPGWWARAPAACWADWRCWSGRAGPAGTAVHRRHRCPAPPRPPTSADSCDDVPGDAPGAVPGPAPGAVPADLHRGTGHRRRPLGRAGARVGAAVPPVRGGDPFQSHAWLHAWWRSYGTPAGCGCCWSATAANWSPPRR